MNNITAGITLFNPEINRLKENINAILPQVSHLYLVDNGSKNITDIHSLLKSFDNYTLIENNKNDGISKALNQLCDIAYKNKSDWVLLLDQDSVAEKELIQKYLKYIDFEKVGIITPYIDDENEKDKIDLSTRPDYEYIDRCYTSASLTKLSIWNEVGGFDEKMFIDCVDFDYCTTIKEHGYLILRDNKAVIHHMLGEAKEILIFMKIGKLFHIKKLSQPFYTYNHSPLRTYYYARNIKYYCYKHRFSIDKKVERRTDFKWLILKIFFESEKFKKIKAIIKGRIDSKKLIKEYKKTSNSSIECK